jgi:alcohol dehydrogenase class IV
MTFTNHMPTKVVFGNGCLNRLGDETRCLGAERIVVVTGRGAMRKTGTLDAVLGLLEGFDVVVFEEVEADPSVETVDSIAEAAAGCDTVVALGGGSPLDAAKAASLVVACGGSARSYLMGEASATKGLNLIAVPTTAGTGSEVTEVSVLSDRTAGLKRSFRSPHMYPKVALDDPQLTKTMPKAVTASSGLDALTHAVEALTSKRSQPLTDPLCMEAAKLALENLEKAYADGQDMTARENMMLASLTAGYGITHAGAGLAHSLSYGLWKAADTPHGLACGTLLPHVMGYNLGYEGGKYARLAKYCGLEDAEELIHRVAEVAESVGAPKNLRGLGIGEKDIDAMAEEAMGGSTKVNPRALNSKQMRQFITEIL